MHKQLFQWLALAVLIVMLAACADAAAPVVEATEEAVATAEVVVEPTIEPTLPPAEPGVTVEIVTADETRAVTLAELQQLPVTEGYRRDQEQHRAHYPAQHLHRGCRPRSDRPGGWDRREHGHQCGCR